MRVKSVTPICNDDEMKFVKATTPSRLNVSEIDLTDDE